MSEREKKDKRIVKMELMYTSTRNANEKVTASQAILKGLAEDGGLFVPVLKWLIMVRHGT